MAHLGFEESIQPTFLYNFSSYVFSISNACPVSCYIKDERNWSQFGAQRIIAILTALVLIETLLSLSAYHVNLSQSEIKGLSSPDSDVTYQYHQSSKYFFSMCPVYISYMSRMTLPCEPLQAYSYKIHDFF